MAPGAFKAHFQAQGGQFGAIAGLIDLFFWEKNGQKGLKYEKVGLEGV